MNPNDKLLDKLQNEAFARDRRIKQKRLEKEKLKDTLKALAQTTELSEQALLTLAGQMSERQQQKARSRRRWWRVGLFVVFITLCLLAGYALHFVWPVADKVSVSPVRPHQAPMESVPAATIPIERLQPIAPSPARVAPVAIMPVEPLPKPVVQSPCQFADLDTSALSVYAGGAYKGHKLDYAIDNSGHQATQFDVLVNLPGQAVGLILGAYEPSIWQVRWTAKTQIKAVLVTGYHQQIVEGLPDDIPRIISTYKSGHSCGHTYVSSKKQSQINFLSQRFFAQPVTQIHSAKQGQLNISMPMSASVARLSVPTRAMEHSKALAGEAGLNELLHQGLIRPLTEDDVLRWQKKQVLDHNTFMSLSEIVHSSRRGHAYVILHDITVPAGLYGAHSVTFFLPKGVPYPKGKLGHSSLYDFNYSPTRINKYGVTYSLD